MFREREHKHTWGRWCEVEVEIIAKDSYGVPQLLEGKVQLVKYRKQRHQCGTCGYIEESFL